MTKTININGTEVYINGEGQTIVMIHGWPDTHEIWHKQVDFFQKTFKCVTFTLPSFSKNDNNKYTFEQIIDRIDEIVNTVSPNEKIILMVHDWGCVFGYEYAMTHQHKIAKMIGIDIGDAASKDFQKSLSIPAMLMVFSYQTTLAVGYLLKNDTIHKLMAKVLQARSNQANIHSGMGLPYAMRWFGVAGGINNLQAVEPNFPFFYTYATKKPFMFHTEKWANTLALNKSNKVQGFACSHWLMIDKAEKFNQAVKNWIG